MKKAILAVSFGTSHLDTLEKTIAAIEAEFRSAFPDREVRRAFTSGMIIRKLEKRDGTVIDTVDAALDRLAREGFADVVIQPTHIINGDEYDKLCALAAPMKERFSRMTFGAPLLTAVEDYKAAARALAPALPPMEEGQAVVYMGHGTGHHANAAYALMEYVFHDMGRRDVVIGTVEGYPGLDEVIRRLAEMGGIQKIYMAPLMVVAGDHAKNDMAGEEPDSWKSQLEALGYDVTCSLQGLGENAGIRRLFADHAGAAPEKKE